MKKKRREGEPTTKRKKREGETTKKKKRRALRVDDEDYRDYDDEVEEDDSVVFNLQRTVRDIIVEALEEHDYNIAETVGVLTSEIKFVVDTYEDD